MSNVSPTAPMGFFGFEANKKEKDAFQGMWNMCWNWMFFFVDVFFCFLRVLSFIDETEILNSSSWIAPSYPQLMISVFISQVELSNTTCNAMGFCVSISPTIRGFLREVDLTTPFQLGCRGWDAWRRSSHFGAEFCCFFCCWLVRALWNVLGNLDF